MSRSSVANSQWSSIAVRSVVESAAHLTSGHVVAAVVETVIIIIIEWSAEFVAWILEDCNATFGRHLATIGKVE